MISMTIGPMFSGKTSALVTRANRSCLEGYRPILFRPKTDTRAFRTHTGPVTPAMTINDSFQVSTLDEATGFVALYRKVMSYEGKMAAFFDEIQFFDFDRAAWCVMEELTGIERFYFFGLNLDARGKPWPMVQDWLPYATEINLLSAVCSKCLKPAHRTQRKTPYPDENQVAIGSDQDYTPRCRDCWVPWALEDLPPGLRL